TVAFMLDQCHNVEEKIPGQIRSVLNVQEMTARGLPADPMAAFAASGYQEKISTDRIGGTQAGWGA
ncbi:rhamnose isomerase, partial [Cryobacterium sp. TMT2-4]